VDAVAEGMAAARGIDTWLQTESRVEGRRSKAPGS
jgi:hypothetical protein